MIYLINMEDKDFNEFNPTNMNSNSTKISITNEVKNSEISTYFKNYYYK